jgi:metal-sulfur cluster biosynthetic enzyme
LEKVEVNIQKYWNALKEVMDPEFPVSVVDMGLIYNIEESKEGHVDITMTYTAVSCACMEWIEEDIKNRLMKEPNVQHVNINVVWDPPWTVERLSKEAREKLKYWGVRAK